MKSRIDMKKMILAVVAAVAVAGSAGAQSGVRYPYVTSENGGVVVVLRDSKGGIDESSLFSSRVTASKTGNEASADNRMSRKFRVQKSNPGQKTWSDAMSYCDNLTEEGYSDWRLPSQRELMMIWLLGGSSNVTSGDKNDTGLGSACSGIVMKNSNTQNAKTKPARSINRISGSPPAANRNAASMGLNTTIRLLEKEFIPLTFEIFSFGTSLPVATADAGCWKAFVIPTTALMA